MRRRRSVSQDSQDYVLPPEYPVRRRPSFDDQSSKPKEFVVNVERVTKAILQQEDTNQDYQITIEDTGPKTIRLGTLASEGIIKKPIHGHYMISSLLQELSYSSDNNNKTIVDGRLIIEESVLSENPVERLHRLITTRFWPALTRRLDAEGLQIACMDAKNRGHDQQPRIYVPFNDQLAYEYYLGIARSKPELDLDVVVLPDDMPATTKQILAKPGILSLALSLNMDSPAKCSVRAVPFVVPGGRFNELYGWDSYFCALGLLEDSERNPKFLFLAKSLADNLIYEIEHYGKVLNANRSYFLTRSQPPFLTSMISKIYEKLLKFQKMHTEGQFGGNFGYLFKENPKAWLKRGLLAAIKEYNNAWMSEPRLVPEYSLSRYFDEGTGIPTETEATHYNVVLEEYAKEYKVSIKEFIELYNSGKISEPKLDEYFKHDRALRESGHDTTYRFEGCAANLLTVDLNCLLYKYEMDIGTIILNHYEGSLKGAGLNIDKSSQIWFHRAESRRAKMYDLLWDPEKGIWFDYDFVKKKRSTYESVTTFWTLWSGLVSSEDAELMIKKSLSLFEMAGGLVAGTETSRGPISLLRPNRQWDYPFGWAPHQMLAWEGMKNYGFGDIAKRLAYRWLLMITKCFVDYNAVVPEKFDVVSMTHKITAEYGNVGTDFKFAPKEGFGWMNASYAVGLKLLGRQERRALGLLIPTEKIFKINN